jgi:hypothetical protein
MSIFDRFFKRGAPPAPSGAAEVALDAVIELLALELPALEHKVIEAALLSARLADALRDAKVRPCHPDLFEILAADLDEQALRRCALFVSCAGSDVLRPALPALVQHAGIEAFVAKGFVELARTKALLTLELLRQSEVRREELARAWCAALGCDIVGESAEQSAARLDEIDYARLLAQAEDAKASAEERMKALREQQELAESKRTRRGKW